MSNWNYRILARRIASDSYSDVHFGVYEVYYNDETNIPEACTENPITILSYEGECEDPIESIQWQLDVIKEATKKPVLDYDNFPNEYVKHLRKKKLKQIGSKLT